VGGSGRGQSAGPGEGRRSRCSAYGTTLATIRSSIPPRHPRGGGHRAAVVRDYSVTTQTGPHRESHDRLSEHDRDRALRTRGPRTETEVRVVRLGVDCIVSSPAVDVAADRRALGNCDPTLPTTPGGPATDSNPRHPVALSVMDRLSAAAFLSDGARRGAAAPAYGSPGECVEPGSRDSRVHLSSPTADP
jgi:hypothetical protein